VVSTIGSYLLTSEITHQSEAGLVAAFFISIIPSYISRSTAGSYDYESIAITQIIMICYYWVKSMNSGSILYSSITALWISFLVFTWGGYTFVLNIIPVHMLFLIITQRFKTKHYVAYNIVYVIV